MLCLLSLTLAATLAHALPSAEAAAKKKKKKAIPPPRSLTLTDRADPSVVRIRGGYVVLSTGVRVPRATSANGRHFVDAGTALARLPAWAVAGDMWASDLAQHGGRWLLFFAASVPGMKASSHCIGVAESTSPTGTFQPLDERPLVCPPGNAVPGAEDQFIDIAHGAIDPSFTVIGGRPYLLYKTDGKPSSLRVLPLTTDGRHAAGASRQLLRSGGVVENPVLTRRGRYWFLFTSEGNYGGCGYRTVWRRSLRPLNSWQGAKAHVFLSHAKQQLCGPGGADVVLQGKRQLLYFHAWTCGRTRRACQAPLAAYNPREAARQPVRPLYGLRLGFTRRGYPRIDGWLQLRA